MNTYFSVIVPVFNRAKTIERCINSVINQGYGQWELLLIDDGSTDDTVSVIEKFLKVDSRIKLYQRTSERKKGANACRNIGIENASGDYIFFLDSDDQWSNDRLSNANKYLTNKHPIAVYSGALIYDGQRKVARKSKQIMKNNSPADFILSTGSFAQTSTLIVKREIGLRIKFDENLKRNQDYDFFIRLGLEYEWSYWDNYKDIIIYWNINEKRNLDFPSNLDFYNIHEGKIENKNIAVRFLYNNWLLARKENSDYKDVFKTLMVKQLWKVDFTSKIRILFSELLFQYYLLRGKL